MFTIGFNVQVFNGCIWDTLPCKTTPMNGLFLHLPYLNDSIATILKKFYLDKTVLCKLLFYSTAGISFDTLIKRLKAGRLYRQEKWCAILLNAIAARPMTLHGVPTCSSKKWQLALSTSNKLTCLLLSLYYWGQEYDPKPEVESFRHSYWICN